MSSNANRPPYRQFWFWFVVAIPLSSVLAGIALLHLALQSEDSLVRDDYYKAGLGINQRSEKQQLARALSLRAQLSWQDARWQLELQGQGERPSQLTLWLQHATLASRDQRLRLAQGPDGLYRSEPLRLDTGHFRLQLESTELGWRLQGQAWLPRAQVVSLEP